VQEQRSRAAIKVLRGLQAGGRAGSLLSADMAAWMQQTGSRNITATWGVGRCDANPSAPFRVEPHIDPAN